MRYNTSVRHAAPLTIRYDWRRWGLLYYRLALPCRFDEKNQQSEVFLLWCLTFNPEPAATAPMPQRRRRWLRAKRRNLDSCSQRR